MSIDLRARLLAMRSLLALICVASVMTAGSMLIAAASAEAAEYRVWTCANGSGAKLSRGDAIRIISEAFPDDVYDTCATPGSPVGALVANAKASARLNKSGSGWDLAAAPGTRITALDVWWHWQVLPTAQPSGYITINAPYSVFTFHRAGSFGNPAAPFSEANHQAFRNFRDPRGKPGAPRVGLRAGCESRLSCTTGERVARYETYRVRTVVQDAIAPAGSSQGLQNGQRVGSATPVRAAASDVGGGVREFTLRVDGHAVQRVDGGAGCSDVDASNSDPFEYNLMKPCPSTLAGQLALSRGQMPDNEPHIVTAVATDAAGQDKILGSARAALAAPRTFYDEHGFYNPDLNITAARKGNGQNSDAAAKVTLSFVRGRRSSKRLTVRYSTRPRVRGRVRTAAKKPVAGARLWRAVRVKGGRWRIFGKPLVTSKSGRVSARLPARSPSRKVRLLYFPYSDTNTHASSANRDLRVQATTTIQSDQGGYRNGETLKFSGRLIRKGLIPNKSVYLQAIVRGNWRTFKTTRANSKGRWRMTHRFEATKRPTRYTFRALVPGGDRGWPWATGSSRTLRVLVTP